MSPLFIGYEHYIRGYAVESFTGDECSATNDVLCDNTQPVCDVPSGKCGPCVTDADCTDAHAIDDNRQSAFEIGQPAAGRDRELDLQRRIEPRGRLPLRGRSDRLAL